MQKSILLVLIAGLMFIQTGCAIWKQNRWLAEHHQTLKRLAEGNQSPEQKLDGLAQNYVKFMDQSLNFINPANSAKFVKKYHDQNERYIDKILSDSQKWQSQMNTVEKVELGFRMTQKPYLNAFIDLVPKFKKRYNQYAFIIKLTSKIAGGLTGLAGKALGI
jgi:DNA polymerase II small subunit/DNA polymerase delta subunit B